MDELEQRILDLCEEFTKTGLAKRCQQKGLPSTGTKEEMARSLVESEEMPSADDSTMDHFHDAEPVKLIINFKISEAIIIYINNSFIPLFTYLK